MERLVVDIILEPLDLSARVDGIFMISNSILVHDNQNFSILGLGDTTNGSDRLVIDRVIVGATLFLIPSSDPVET